MPVRTMQNTFEGWAFYSSAFDTRTGLTTRVLSNDPRRSPWASLIESHPDCRGQGRHSSVIDAFNRRFGMFRKHPFSPVPEVVDVKITDACEFGCHFCAPPATLIRTPTGVIPIEQVRPGDTVLHAVNGRLTETTVTATPQRQYVGDLVEIELGNGQLLRLTPDHEVLTQRGWVRAECLIGTDELVIE